MTEHNIFQEIEEDLERQRLEALWKRYGAWIITAAFAFIIGTAAYTSWHSWHIGQQQQATAELLRLLSAKEDSKPEQLDDLIEYAHKNNRLFQSTMAQLDAASLAVRKNKRDKAIEIYDAIAQDPNADMAFRQLADLKSIELQIGTGDPAILKKRLAVLSQDQGPWRYTAMEYQGYLALRTRDTAQAREIFTSLSENAQVPASLSQRASDMLHYLDVQ